MNGASTGAGALPMGEDQEPMPQPAPETEGLAVDIKRDEAETRGHHHVPGEAEPGDLGDRNALHANEIFRRGIEPGKTDGGKGHEADRLQPLAGIDVGTGDAAGGQGGAGSWD